MEKKFTLVLTQEQLDYLWDALKIKDSYVVIEHPMQKLLDEKFVEVNGFDPWVV